MLILFFNITIILKILVQIFKNMGKAVSKPIQVALDCFLWRNIDVTNFDQVYRKLLWSNNRCKKLNKFIKTCKKTAFVNTGCKILQTTG